MGQRELFAMRNVGDPEGRLGPCYITMATEIWHFVDAPAGPPTDAAFAREAARRLLP